MAWWIQSLELADKENRPLGRYRLTATSDEDGGGPHKLCDCNGDEAHATREEAYNCPVAQEAASHY